MIDHNKIPDEAYQQLVELIGKEEAESFIKKVNYDFRSISIRIFYFQIKRAIKENPRLSLIIFILVIALLIYYLLDMFMVI